MEAALRAMSICFLLNLLSPLRRDEQPWLASVTRSLAQHLVYIESNLEFSNFLTSNHYLSDIVGLYCISTFLDGKGMAAKRREYRQRIEAEMARQVYEDGGDYEASTGYHLLVTQLFVTALLLMRADSVSPKPQFVNRLKLMFRFLNVVANSSGELPHVGDCDDGRTELLSDDLQQMITRPFEERNSLRVSNFLGIGQRLLGEGRGPGDDAAWFGFELPPSEEKGPRRTGQGSDEVGQPPAEPITVLPDSGIGVLRHGSAELLFFAVPNGIHGKGSHTHNDKLSFVLRVGGQEIFSDSGTGCYTRDLRTRNRFRSTAAHNTLMVDGTEQNRIHPGPLGCFHPGNEAVVTRIEQGKDPCGRFLRASHMGYCSLGVTHTRTIRLAEKQTFVVEDELAGNGVHDFEFNLQLARDRSAQVASAEDDITCCIPGDPEVQLTIAGPASLQASTQPSLLSTVYGVTGPAVKVRFWGRAALPVRLTTRIWWADVSHAVSNQTSSASCSRDSRCRL